MTNSFNLNYLLRGTWALAACAALACGHRPDSQATPQLKPTLPLPASGLSGQQVILVPLTLVAVEDSLHWEAAFADRRAALTHADSIVGALLQARAPEVAWVLPAELRRAARRSPGIAPDPDQLGTGMLRIERLTMVPDPLRSQLRTLAALAGSGGGRYALVPAALIYRRTGGPADRRTAAVNVTALARAELAMTLADLRTGRVLWHTVAVGYGDDPSTCLTRAVKSLTPGLP